MAFLNNSGDIILDAVLTDLGRKRLSEANGTFEITQFALGDDEIDYSQYNISTGSAYQDLDILQTPILEAITDNIASVKSKLITYADTNLLYLPIMKLMTKNSNVASFQTSSVGNFIAIVNDDGDFTGNGAGSIYGFTTTAQDTLINGNFFSRATGDRTGRSITIHQGEDTSQKSFKEELDITLQESVYFVYLDSRLGTLVTPTGEAVEPSFIDDDQIATYVLDVGNQASLPGVFESFSISPTDTSTPSTILGPVNRSALRFSVRATDNLKFSDFLFEKFGNTNDTTDTSGNYSLVYNIDTQIRVVGGKTGYSLSIPLRFVKIKTFA